jgi:hypothetical protein
MWMMGFWTAPNRARAIDRTIVSIRLGSCQDTGEPGPMPMAKSPAATVSERLANWPKVMVRSFSSMSIRRSGDVAARRATSSHMDPTS